MELVSIFTYLGLYTKVYDSKEKYDKHINLLFMNKLPKYDINNRLHLAILFKMYNNVNFNKQTNISYYMQTLKILDKLDNNQIEYTIYIDNWGVFGESLLVHQIKLYILKICTFDTNLKIIVKLK